MNKVLVKVTMSKVRVEVSAQVADKTCSLRTSINFYLPSFRRSK
jgi:hypothetical protein